MQELPRPAVKLPTLSSQNSDTKLVISRHGGGSDHYSKPTRADMLWLEEASQEQPGLVVRPPILSSQQSYLNLGGNDDGSSEHKGRSDRCSAPIMADMPLGYGEVALQGQPRPVVVSRIRSSQRSDTNSGGDAGGSSGYRGGSDRYDTPTKADMRLRKSHVARTGRTSRSIAYPLVTDG